MRNVIDSLKERELEFMKSKETEMLMCSSSPVVASGLLVFFCLLHSSIQKYMRVLFPLNSHNRGEHRFEEIRSGDTDRCVEKQQGCDQMRTWIHDHMKRRREG